MESNFPRQIESLDAIFGFVEKFFAANDVDPSARYAIGMAIEEIFTNMVKYNPTGEGDIVIRIDRDGDRAVIGLTDSDTEPFDVTATDEIDVTKPIEERVPGGLGIHLVKRLMDEIDYAYHGRESTITLVKKLNLTC